MIGFLIQTRHWCQKTLKNGEQKYYFKSTKNGFLFEKVGLDNDGVLHGNHIFYYPNSKQKSFEGAKVNGFSENEWIHWNKNGKIKNIIIYKHGLVVKQFEIINNKRIEIPINKEFNQNEKAIAAMFKLFKENDLIIKEYEEKID